MTVHTREDLQRLARRARREFSHALMSDTKWRKVLTAVDQAGLAPQRIMVKFIDASEPTAMVWPGLTAQYPPWPWIGTGIGHVELRAIEWLLIPITFPVRRGAANVPPGEVQQNVDAIEELITSLGQFPLERSAEGLKIVGYRR